MVEKWHDSIGIRSFNTFNIGARLLVVQDAFEIILLSRISAILDIPNVIIGTMSSVAGAEIITFLAPAFR